MNQFPPLIPNNIYHLFNRGNGNERIFKTEENYHFFIRKAKDYLLPVMDIYTYSLIPNHFHFLVRIKDKDAVRSVYATKKLKKAEDTDPLFSDFLMEQVANWLNSYTKSFNKVYNRKGSLFMTTKRTEVKSEEGLTNMVFYVHKNAVHHGLTRRIGEWSFDAYQEILSDKPVFLLRDELFRLFGSKEEFRKAHENLEVFKK